MNHALINVAALCIILATGYGAFKEVRAEFDSQQAARTAQIEAGQRIIEETLER